jgi:Tfp pilus assembly protein PilX
MSRNENNDEGAVLILALMFVLVVGLLGGALVTLAGNGLSQTTQLQANRSLTYAADSMVQTAIQQVRDMPQSAPAGYNGAACPAVSATIPENGTSGTPITVQCAVGMAPLPFERSITFVACPSAAAAGSCITTTDNNPIAGPSAIVVATTLFSDLKHGCSIALSLTDTCFAPATSVDVTNWDVTTANG